MHIVVGRAFAEHASSLYDNTFLHSFMLLSPSLAFPPCTKSLPHFYIESESDDLFLFPTAQMCVVSVCVCVCVCVLSLIHI